MKEKVNIKRRMKAKKRLCVDIGIFNFRSIHRVAAISQAARNVHGVP